MIKNHPSTLSNGEALNRRLGHPTLVMLAMNDFLAQRFALLFMLSGLSSSYLS